MHRGAAPLFVATAVLYFVLGYWLNVHLSLVDNDGPSRVANAGYILFSRDPHVAAVGFVWNPLPSFLEVPLLLLRHLWPALQTKAIAGIIESSLFMAGSVCLVAGIARDRGMSAWTRWLLVAVFACNPMIIEYAGNGLSEASFVFFTLWATRRLLQWIEDDRTIHLVVCGVALGLAYLTRYEAIVSGLSAGIAVALQSLVGRSASGGRDVWAVAGHRVVLLLFPLGVTFAVWSLTSWLLTGDVLAQFQSQYGNSAQLSVFRAGAAPHPVATALRSVVSIEPLLPLLIVVGVAVALRARESMLLAAGPAAGILAFEMYGAISGSTAAWFRFYLMSVPLVVTVIAAIAGSPSTRDASAQRWRGGLALASSVAALLTSLPATWTAMLDPLIGNQPQQYALGYLTHDPPDPTLAPFYGVNTAQDELAAYLDRLHLPEGSVLLDPFFGNQIWLASLKDKQFVVASDYDFLHALNDPSGSGIQYILAPNPEGEGSLNEVNKRYPTFWSDGAGIATPLVTFSGGPGQTEWRIYRVIR